MADAAAIAEAIQEVFGFFRDLNDPVKREAKYRLYLEKRARLAIESADDCIDTLEKLVYLFKTNSNDQKEIERLERWAIHYNKRFKAYK